MCTRSRRRESVRQKGMPSELTCKYSLRVSKVSRLLIRITRERSRWSRFRRQLICAYLKETGIPNRNDQFLWHVCQYSVSHNNISVTIASPTDSCM